MKKAILLLALFPFLHNTSYQVDYVSCKPNEILVRHEEETIQIQLFNTKIKNEKGWNTACRIMKDAKKLRIEIDSSTKIEDPLSVYVFADDVFVQEEMIKTSQAYIMIHNPEYTYVKRLEKAADTLSVMGKAVPEEKEKSYPIVAPAVLAVTLLLWSIMMWYIVHKHRKKSKDKKFENN